MCALIYFVTVSKTDTHHMHKIILHKTFSLQAEEEGVMEEDEAEEMDEAEDEMVEEEEDEDHPLQLVDAVVGVQMRPIFHQVSFASILKRKTKATQFHTSYCVVISIMQLCG